MKIAMKGAHDQKMSIGNCFNFKKRAKINSGNGNIRYTLDQSIAD